MNLNLLARCGLEQKIKEGHTNTDNFTAPNELYCLSCVYGLVKNFNIVSDKNCQQDSENNQ